MAYEVQVKPQVLPPSENRAVALASADDSFTIMEFWRVLIKRRLVVIAVTILSLAGALWYALRTTPVYESVSRIEIRPQEIGDESMSELIQQREEDQQTELQTEV